jgi:PAS domain S-box-containing protein
MHIPTGSASSKQKNIVSRVKVTFMLAILLVDDEPAVLEVCRKFLERTGDVAVDTSESAEDALARLAGKHYDAIVADYQMTGMDGISLLKAVRGRGQDIPFILFTGRGREDVAIDALNNGADSYLQKGSDPTAQIAGLMDKVKRAVQVREARQQLKEIIQETPIPTFVIDRDHHVISWNRALEASSGITAPAVIGTSDHWRAFYDQQRPCLADLIVDQNTDGITRWYGGKYARSKVIDHAYEATDYFPRLNGGTYLFFTAAPIRDTGGNIVGAIETLQNITQLRQVESELLSTTGQLAATAEELAQNRQMIQESEEMYRLLADYAFDGVLVQDFSGTILYASPSFLRMMGLSDPALVIGKSSFDFVSPEFRTTAIRDLQNILAGKEKYVRKYRARTVTGNDLWVESVGTRIQYHGQPANFVALRDITGRIQADEALTEANKKLNLLNSITRHDVANQLTVLQGYIQLAMMKGTDPVTSDFLKKIDAVSRTIARQIEFTRTYQELGEHAPGWYHLGKIVDGVKPKGVAFSRSGTDVEIFADPMLQKVFFNIFDNAIRHGERVTRIDLRCTPAEDGLVIVIEDDGIGIPLDEKQKIFDKGYGKNTGFGLFLAREILSITGITIFETGKHGNGARFEISVPKAGFRQAGTGPTPDTTGEK